MASATCVFAARLIRDQTLPFRTSVSSEAVHNTETFNSRVVSQTLSTGYGKNVGCFFR